MKLKGPFEVWESSEGRVYVLDWQGTCIAKAVEVDGTKACAKTIARRIAGALNRDEEEQKRHREMVAFGFEVDKIKCRPTKGARKR